MRLGSLGLFAAGVALELSATPAFSQAGSERGWLWDSGRGWGGMMGGGVGMILFWGVIIVVIVLAVRRFGGFGPGRESAAPTEKTPLQILQNRYARGEIDKQEYEERRKTLGG